jgi:hypothetical protein
VPDRSRKAGHRQLKAIRLVNRGAQLALKEIFDLLRPGGLFISKTPCLGGVYRLLQPVLAALQLFGKAAKAGIPQTRFS